MAHWNGYIQFEAITLSQANFDALCETFAALPPVEPVGPNDFMHGRIRNDGLARGFEMKFDPAQVEVDTFKQFMADLFEVPVEDVGDTIFDTLSYSGEGRETRIWSFTYPAGVTERLRVYRFGRGETWDTSRLERKAYLFANKAAWEPAIP